MPLTDLPMPTPVKLALLVMLLPLGAFALELLHALFTRRMPAWADKLSTAVMVTALGTSLYLLFTEVLAHPHGIEKAHLWATSWMNFGSSSPLRVDFSILVDNLTVVMLCVVTGVSTLVHLYSTSYMHGELRYQRFFAYLSLFTFSMLGLVIANNILLLFIFWELVGVCSYFLIGFYIEKKSAGDASKKAFITNRVGDALFMTAIMIVFSVISKTSGGKDVLSFQMIYQSIGELGQGKGPWVGESGLLTLAGIFFFMGCVTKSAQFPLHIWLPDAMEGPTPVSALIHAATMVAAGVYMIVRMFPVLAGEGYLSGDYFHSSPLLIVALVGGFTSIFAGTIALVQQDLKKGLAYSTVSQLGYMAMAVGAGSTTAGMFHLFTHAFFKACLFLGAGSVIHAVHSQLMKDMGGLRKKMPITYWTFLISTLAIAGFPLTSGFLSKEMVLSAALAFSNMHPGSLVHKLPFIFAAATAVLTTFYMFRMVWLTFFGKGAWEGGHHGAADHAHGHAAPAHAPAPASAHGAHAHDPHDAHGHAHPAPHGAHGAHGHDAHAPAAAAASHAPAAHDDHGHHGEPHESPWRMALPLVVLGTLAVISGGIGIPGAPGSTWMEHRVNEEALVKGMMTESVIATEETKSVFEKQFIHEVEGGAAPASEIGREYKEAWHHAHIPVLAVSACALLFGIGGSYFFFMVKRGRDYVSPSAILRSFRTTLENLWYVDAFFIKGVVPVVGLVMGVAAAFDKFVIDGIVNLCATITRLISWVSGKFDFNVVDGAVRGTGDAVMAGGTAMRKTITGRIQDYVKYTVLGLAILMLIAALMPH